MLLTLLVRSHTLIISANDKLVSTITLQESMFDNKNYLIGLRFYIEMQQSSSDVSNEEVAADCDNLEIFTATSHLYYGTIRIAQLTCLY